MWQTDSPKVTAKMKGGPCNGKSFSVENGTRNFIIEVPIFSNINMLRASAPVEIAIAPTSRRGEYVKTHRVLKNGTQIFQWIGYTDGNL